MKEEVAMFKTALALKKELENINKQLNEVTAGGPMAPGNDGVHAGQLKPKFEKLNATTIKEDGEDETIDTATPDAEVTGDVVGDEAGAEPGTEVPQVPQGPVGPDAGNDLMISKAEVEAAFLALKQTLNLDLSNTSVEPDMDDVPADDEAAIEFGGEDAAPDMDAETDETPEEEAAEHAADEDDNIEEAKPQVAECGDEMMDEKTQAINEERARWIKLAGIIKS